MPSELLGFSHRTTHGGSQWHLPIQRPPPMLCSSSTSGTLQQKAMRSAFIILNFFLTLCRVLPRPWVGCHSQLTILPYCQDIRSPLPKISGFSLKSSAGKVVSRISCSAYAEDFSSPFTGCDKPASLNPSIQMDELITKGATEQSVGLFSATSLKCET